MVWNERKKALDNRAPANAMFLSSRRLNVCVFRRFILVIFAIYITFLIMVRITRSAVYAFSVGSVLSNEG